MAVVAILKIHFNGHYLVAIAHICRKFGLERNTDVPETEIPQTFTSVKIYDGGGRQFENTSIAITRPPFKLSSLNLVRG